MASDAHPTYLSPSELGSKDYWENYYARTRAHISNDADTAPDAQPDANDSDADSDLNDEDDPGTSWFSEHNAPEKVLRFLTCSSFPLSPRNTRRRAASTSTSTSAATATATQPSILDLGTGNGSMLALLQKKGKFSGQMVGVDYSAQSIELARELQRVRGHSAYRTDSEESGSEEESGDEKGSTEENGESGESPAIEFEEWDILGSSALLSRSGGAVQVSDSDEVLSWFPYARGGFDIVLDKGTFDAVSLAGHAKETRVCERYPDIARQLLRAGGFLVVTSCNWTEEELVSWFTGAGADRLVVWGRVEYPRFRFGGHEGQGVCTVCFQRVVDS